MFTLTQTAVRALSVAAALVLASCAGCGTPEMKLDPTTVTLRGGQRQAFTVTVTGVSDPAVTWAVEEQAGGTVDANGVYTAPYFKGTYHVKATSVALPELSQTAEITVSGSASALLVSISPETATVGTGEQLQFAATVAGGANTAVAWSIMEGTAGGTVSNAGLYVAPSTPGTYHVVASAVDDPGAYAMAEVTVTQGGTLNVAINPTTTSLGVLQTKQFSATVTGTNNPEVTWTVQEANGGTVSATGLYTAPATPGGPYRVVATSKANPARSATATVTVIPTAVTVSPAAATVEIGTTQQFSATVTGATNTAVQWSVKEGPNGGSINATGLYTPPSTPGTYHVVATSAADTSKRVEATVTVIEAVSVTVDPSSVNLTVSQTQQFAATVTGTTNQAVTWSVKQANGGTINNTGLYTAPATAGTFNVEATWTFGSLVKKGTATVTVALGIGITPSSVTLNAGGTQTFTATGIASSNVTWSVEEGATGGSITSQGAYTAPASAGTYHVRATNSADVNKYARATVMVLAAPVSVSGTITYSGALTGDHWVYVLVAESDNKPGLAGTAVKLVNGSAPFTIEGLRARGNLQIRAFLDTTDTGTYHQAAQPRSGGACTSYDADPFASAPLNVNTSSNMSGVTLALQDAVWDCLTATDAPSALTVIPFDKGALVLYDDGSSTPFEVCPRYTLYWGTSPKPGGFGRRFFGGGSSPTGQLTFAASTPNMVVQTGLTNGTQLYFSLTCEDVSAPLYVDAPSPVTPGPNTSTAGTYTVSGTVTGPSLINAPLILAALSETGGKVVKIDAPNASQPFSIPGMAPGSYKLYAVRDLGDNGLFSLTDPNNFSVAPPVVVSTANVGNVQVPLSPANSAVRITTRHVNANGTRSFGMTLSLRPNLKRPVKARITTAAKLSVPVDLPLVDFGGGLHAASFDLGGVAPAAGDSYTLSVTYSDGTTDSVTGQVTAVLATVAASTPVGSITNPTPVFTWTGPTPGPTGTWTQDLEVIGYETSKLFSGGFVDQVVGYAYGLPSTTKSVPWSNLTLVSGFTGLSNNFLDSYDWQLTVTDANGNWSRTVTTFSLQ